MRARERRIAVIKIARGGKFRRRVCSRCIIAEVIQVFCDGCKKKLLAVFALLPFTCV